MSPLSFEVTTTAYLATTRGNGIKLVVSPRVLLEVFSPLKGKCQRDCDLFWSKPCHNTFTYIRNNTETPSERNQPIFERGTNLGPLYPIWETEMQELEKSLANFFSS